MLAVNEENIKSEFSNDCIFALASLPSQPNQVAKNDQLSSSDTIFVEWDSITTDTLRVLGYRLYADTGRNDDMRMIYDGSTDPQQTYYAYTKVSNLGQPIERDLFYRF